MTKPVLRRILGLCLALVALSAGQGVMGQAAQSVFIYGVDASAFPAVKIRARILDATNRPRADLSAGAVTVYENGALADKVQITPLSEPLGYVFVLDVPRSANYRQIGVKNLQDGLAQLVTSGAFRDGADKVALLARRNRLTDLTELLLPSRQKGEDFVSAIRAYDFAPGTGATRGLEAMNDALLEVGKMSPVPGAQPAAIVFITSGIEDPQADVAKIAAQNYASKASLLRAPIFVMQTNPSGAGRAALETLALSSGGKYIVLNSATVAAQMDALFKEIGALRAAYQINYTSVLADNGPRRITVNSPQEAALAGSYTAQVSAPRVNMEIAQGSVLDRLPETGATTVNPAYKPLRITVNAVVDWADKITREIRSARLLVNGSQAAIVTAFAPGAKQVSFEVDVSEASSIAAPVVALKVEILDSVGLTGTAERSLQTRFLPLPTPTVPVKDNTPLVVGGGLAGLALVAVLVLSVVLLRRRAALASASGAPKPTKKKNASSKRSFAQLQVLNGPPEMIGKELTMSTSPCVLGREGANMPVTRSERSSISREHCVLMFDPLTGLSVTDRGSTNGTWVDGRKLNAGESVAVHDGSEIMLGDLRRDGVKLRVALEDKTRIVR